MLTFPSDIISLLKITLKKGSYVKLYKWNEKFIQTIYLKEVSYPVYYLWIQPVQAQLKGLI